MAWDFPKNSLSTRHAKKIYRLVSTAQILKTGENVPIKPI